MNRFTSSFFPQNSLFCITCLLALLALSAIEVNGQTPSQPVNPYQKISFKTTGTCSVPAAGEVTALVKNGVELSTTDDWDCDGVPDAYDNCVGIPNPTQLDSNHNGIGDACEDATNVSAGLTAKATPKSRTKERKERSADRRSKGRRDRRERSKPTNSKARSNDRGRKSKTQKGRR